MKRDDEQVTYRMRQMVARAIASNVVVSLLARAAIRAGWAVSRLWSHIRFKALVPTSGDSVCHWSVEFQCPENLRVGTGVVIGPLCRVASGAEVVIEDNVTLSRGVVIETAGLIVEGAPPYQHRYRPIRIRQGAWIATNAVVLGGVTVGKGAVIGAGAVITRDVPDGGVVVGGQVRSLTAKLGLNDCGGQA